MVAEESRAAKQEFNDLTKQAREEADPEKRKVILLQRDVHFYEYHALVSDRLAWQSRSIVGHANWRAGTERPCASQGIYRQG
jgi:hypothetical protein